MYLASFVFFIGNVPQMSFQCRSNGFSFSCLLSQLLIVISPMMKWSESVSRIRNKMIWKDSSRRSDTENGERERESLFNKDIQMCLPKMEILSKSEAVDQFSLCAHAQCVLCVKIRLQATYDLSINLFNFQSQTKPFLVWWLVIWRLFW